MEKLKVGSLYFLEGGTETVGKRYILKRDRKRSVCF